MGITPLHIAAGSGQEDKVAALLNAGADPDARTAVRAPTARRHAPVFRPRLLTTPAPPSPSRASGPCTLPS